MDTAVRYRTLWNSSGIPSNDHEEDVRGPCGAPEIRLALIAKAESLRELLLLIIKVDQVCVISGIFLVSSAHREMCPRDDSQRAGHMPQTGLQPRLQIDHKQHQGREQPEVLQQYECQVGTRRLFSSSEGYAPDRKKEHIRQQQRQADAHQCLA